MEFILSRRKLIYSIAIATVLLLIILIQGINQYQITENSRYAGLINIAGRQRMLSQKISKQAYRDPGTLKDTMLADALAWKEKHSYLREQANTRSAENVEMGTLFEKIDPHLQAMVSSVRQFHAGNLSVTDFQQQIGQHEQSYLQGMDRIVFLWQEEAEESLIFFSWLEIGMAGISVLVLLIEYLFIFRPAFELLHQQNSSIQHKNTLLKDRVEDMEYANEQLFSLQKELKNAVVKSEQTNQRLQGQLVISNHQNRQLENAQKIAKIGYWSWDLKEKLEWSDQTYKIHDMSREGKEGPGFDDFIDRTCPEDRHIIFENIKTTKAQGNATYRYRFLDRAGHIRYIQAVGQAAYDTDGEVIGLFGVVRNITEEVTKKKRLQDFNENLKKLVELSAVTTFESQIESGLKYTCRFLNMEMGIVNKLNEGNLHLEYVHSSADLVMERRSKMKLEDTICSIPIESAKLHMVTEREQFSRPFSWINQMSIQTYIGVPLFLEEKVMGTVSFFSREKRSQAFSRYEQEYVMLLGRIISFVMEKQRYIRKLESMQRHQENMMHIVAHDIRGPLNRLYSILKLYPESTAEAQHDLMQMIEREFAAGSTMIDDMLNVFSLESEHQISFSLENISEFVRKVAQKTRNKTNTFNLSFEVDIEDDLFASINTEMMERVMDNLLDNAIKFTQRGGKIYLGLHKQDDQLQIAIKDNGIGIPPEIQPFLFQKFDKKMRRQGLRGEKSNGLGMSIVKEIVEKHRGKLALQSEGNGAGTQFNISLPLQKKAGTAVKYA